MSRILYAIYRDDDKFCTASPVEHEADALAEMFARDHKRGYVVKPCPVPVGGKVFEPPANGTPGSAHKAKRRPGRTPGRAGTPDFERHLPRTLNGTTNGRHP